MLEVWGILQHWADSTFHFPALIFIAETKLRGKSASELRRKFGCGFTSGITVNSQGRSGGITLFWKDTLDVTVLNFTKHRNNATAISVTTG
ncbi:hypothetical protein PanWU01x14_311280 [Parasponia andersonii]|uniref:Endonuclease/exonuclease/phosphatase n=1 Tax=Parasponia andersonii TaxID=3476 RepID=A0A2P5AQ20_PARAD|nr:hypothetical protein PanWU01x14_311280 [Parasponia andersonii]